MQKSVISALKVAVLYVILGSGWILLSDKLLLWAFGMSDQYALLQTVKGWVYVFMTGFLFFYLVFRELRKSEALAEDKIILNRELNHRIKNNLQMILSLVHLQMGKTGLSDETRLVLVNVYTQLNSISLIHQRLLGRAESARIDFKAYLEELVNELSAVFRFESHSIEVEMDVVSTDLPLDRITSIGMIVNELVTNSVRHGFKGRGTGHIEIKAWIDRDILKLSVADDGNGYAETDEKPNGCLGLALIDALLGQLGGTQTIDKRNGLTIILDIPVIPG